MFSISTHAQMHHTRTLHTPKCTTTSTHTQTHSYIHTHTCTHFLLPITLFLISYTRTFSSTHNLSHTHLSFCQSCYPPSFFFSLALTLSKFPSHSLPPSLTLLILKSLPLSLTIPLSLTLSFSSVLRQTRCNLIQGKQGKCLQGSVKIMVHS